MYWLDQDAPFVVPDDVVDVGYRLDCRCLPLDHAHALARALCAALPWLRDENNAGIHSIHGAASGNGWFRPPDMGSEMLHLPRRTRLYLRLPKERLADAKALTGHVMNVHGYSVGVGQLSVRKLSSVTTLFSRYVVAEGTADETEFTQDIVEEVGRLGITVKRLVCGLEHTIWTPSKQIPTRSVLLADLSVQDSVRIQERGIGTWRKLGCGLFVPYKSINAFNTA